MDFGVATLTRGALGNRKGYLAAAEAAERLGYGFISVNDHIVVPRDIASRYPYSESGEWAARTAGECLDQLATLGLPGGAHRAAAAAHLGDGGAAAPSRADRQDAGHHRRAVRRTIDRRLRRRLAEGGVRGGRRAGLRRARPGDGRIPRRLQGALDGRRSRLSRPARPVREHHVPAQARAEAAPADLDRRREPGRHEAGGARRRRLVSGQQQSAVPPGHRRTAWRRGAASCAGSARPPGATRPASTSPTSP